MKIKELLQNFMYTIISNLVTLVISALVILVVPKLVGIEAYGYLQLYLFYTTYVGMMHFGWIDGIYLRFGGAEYEELNKKNFNSQFYLLFIFQIILMIGMIMFASIVTNPDRSFIWVMTALCMLLTNMRQIIYVILQDTNRIKAYSAVNIFDRITYVILLILLLAIGVRNYRILVFADITGKIFSLIYAMYFCKDIVIRKVEFFYFDIKEMWKNIRIGVKLLFANFASLFIVGIIRLGIEQAWGVTVFGKVSLMLSISNLLMVFINAISIVLFPMLRKINIKKLSFVYPHVRELLMIILFTGLFFYYPIRLLLPVWLPQYAESVKYMAILFPMVVYEGKFSLLVSTYMKTLRYEKELMLSNLVSLSISIVITFVGIYLFNSLDFLMFGIIFVLCFRSSFSEIVLGRKIGINSRNGLLVESVIVFTFILSSWLLNSPVNFVIYVIFYLLYMYVKRTEIKKSYKSIKVIFDNK